MPDPTPVAQPNWGWLVVIYLFIAGVGAGSYLVAWWSGRRQLSATVASVGRIISAPLVVIGTALLFFDLGAGFHHPLRVIHLYSHPASMMSLGTWVLTLFVIVAAVFTYVPLLAKLRPLAWLQKVTAWRPFAWLDGIAVVLAVCVAVYTGLLLGVVGAVPFWNSPLLPVVFAVSAVSTGMAAALAGGVIVSRSGSDGAAFGGLHLGVMVTEVVMVALFGFFAATNHQAAARTSFHSVITGSFAPAFWVGFVVIGLALPIAYNIVARVSSLGELLHSPAFVLAECLCVLVGGFVLRYLIVSAGAIQHVFVTLS